MPVTYTQTLSTDMIVTEIEALLDWRHHILRQCFFPGAEKKSADEHAPAAFLTWCAKGVEAGMLDAKIVERIILVHNELTASALFFLQGCKDGAPPSLESYDAFERCFEAFITQIRRLQQDASQAGISVDPITGLRTAIGMHNEMKREQDRFDRKGTSFSIACIQVDGIDYIESVCNQKLQNEIYAGVARQIAKDIRSFDDAYYIGRGEFVIVLKHLEFIDACAVMDRLRAEVENFVFTMPDGQELKVTASFGVAEALQKDKADVACAHAKSALQRAKDAGGNRVREFLETSVLERLARDIKK